PRSPGAPEPSMARELSQEAVLDFLWGAGGRAPNAALLRHFQRFLRDPALPEQQLRQRRELFKRLLTPDGATQSPAPRLHPHQTLPLPPGPGVLPSARPPPSQSPPRFPTHPAPSRSLQPAPARPPPSHSLQPPPARPPPSQSLQPAPARPPPSHSLQPPPAGPPPSQSLLPAQGPAGPQAPESSPPAPLPVFRSIRCQLALLEAQGTPSSLPDDCGRQLRAVPPKSSPRSVPSRGLSVPLGQREHAWLVAVSAGHWARVRGLFLEEPELALQRDFISGFTVLHWLAKHGDGPGLQELAVAARQAGLALDVDARSGCGYTPLHLAAIHGHQLVIKVLVLQLGCRVQVRDGSGRQPWEYLGSSTSGEIWQLLEAP
ncbi:SWAHB protein, partial [Todus mexicanus]|nr:SWAHB protein [Todus mexicanus]